jgi:hypothetical protein
MSVLVEYTSHSLSASVTPATVTTPLSTLAYSFTVAYVAGPAVAAPSLTATLTQGGSPRSFTSGPSLYSGDANANGQFDPGETWFYTATYTVPQTDIDNGATLVATANFLVGGVLNQTASTSASITQNRSLSVTKTASVVKAPGNVGADAERGDTINYAYAVINNGNVTLTNVDLNDVHQGQGTWNDPVHVSLQDNGTAGDSPDTSANATIWGTLAPGDAVNFAASYTVTQQDIDAQ